MAIPFPIIADLDRKVATAYGMVMPAESGTETSRRVFVIDPRGIVRAMIYYPLTTGRNIDEILRLLDAQQTTDAHQVANPANWQPGPPPSSPTAQAATHRRELTAVHDRIDDAAEPGPGASSSRQYL